MLRSCTSAVPASGLPMHLRAGCLSAPTSEGVVGPLPPQPAKQRPPAELGVWPGILRYIIGLDREIGAHDHLNWEAEHLKRCRSAESVSVQFFKKEDCFIFQSTLSLFPNL